MKKIVIFTLLIFTLVGCSNASKMNSVSFNGESFYVNDNEFLYPYLFTSSIEIDEISKIYLNDDDIRSKGVDYIFIVEKNEDGTPLKVDSQYVYGILFNLEKIEDNLLIDSLTIETSNQEQIMANPNIVVKKVNTSNREDIFPIDIPITYNIKGVYKIIVQSKRDIEIEKIEFVSEVLNTTELYVNAIEFDQQSPISVNANSDINIEMVLQPKVTYHVDENYFNRGYVKITYRLDGEQQVFTSDFTTFGSVFEMLKAEVNN